MFHTWKSWLVFSLGLTLTGCACCRQPRPAPVPCPPPGRVFVPGPGFPPGPIIPSGGFVPPGGVPLGGPVIPPPDPLPGVTPPPGPTPIPSITPPGPGGPGRVESRWVPVPDSRVLPPVRMPYEPTPIAKDPPKGPSRVLLFPPEISEEPPLDTPKPPVRKSSSLPVGIPGFAAARDNVATGLRPSLDEGLDWLAANGYRAVLHLRGAAEPEAADRKQVEKRGMKYLTLEINPVDLTRETVAEFIRAVRDAGALPLFVYDRDASLAGSLWYAYFRLAEELPEDAARLRAGALGLRESGPMWDAVRRLAP